ncbi:cytochrome c oxidase subunit 2 [Silvibacterium bohemicum]|uniref:Cytochrome aa3 subunit 2 n=1 Tax=Silvibacterium bohemicum TaxID=1577686 RepID=A0A841JTN7_9BACT|nr:cytochrome c oxidase subunit 2 [Silvibacterium bohemicum]
MTIFWITGIVTCLVLATLLYFVAKRRHSILGDPLPQTTTAASDRLATRAVTGAVIVTILLLFVMLISSFITSRRLGHMHDQDAMTIEVYGHQWWWEIHYPYPKEPYREVITANELHVPVGTLIRIEGTSNDVIHSFWAPNLNGKRDLLPGYTNDLMFLVDKPGIWRGQCAEFCGLQHAHMSFFTIAESKENFNRWMEAQRQSAADPKTEQTRHGQQVFLTHSCVLCHAIGGTTAGSHVGPDLTHLATRSTIAAGTLPNTIGNLAGWILNAQSIKPGCRMPPNQLSGSDLQDLLAYMETLR